MSAASIRYAQPLDPDNDPISPEQEKTIMVTRTPSQRMEFIREERNMNKSNFSKSIGLTPAGYQAMIHRQTVQESVAIATEYRHGFSAEWILHGTGDFRCDQWELMRGEIEDTFLRDMKTFTLQKLKRTKPIVYHKDKNEREIRTVALGD
jgi:hypothetical protein